MSRKRKDLQQLALSHTEGAIKTVVGILNQPKASDIARLRAAEIIFDRAWGKAKQAIEHGVSDDLADLMREVDGQTRTSIPLVNYHKSNGSGETTH